MILSCPNYLLADVSDGEDLFRHQQEVTGGQLVTILTLFFFIVVSTQIAFRVQRDTKKQTPGGNLVRISVFLAFKRAK